MNFKEIKNAGVAMAVNIRRASWFFIAGGSVFGYNSDVQHFIVGFLMFLAAQFVALLLIIAWASFDAYTDDVK